MIDLSLALVWISRAYRRGADREACYRWARALCWIEALRWSARRGSA